MKSTIYKFPSIIYDENFNLWVVLYLKGIYPDYLIYNTKEEANKKLEEILNI